METSSQSARTASAVSHPAISASAVSGSAVSHPAGSAAALGAVPLRRIPTQARSRDKVARALAAAERIVRREGVDAITLPRVAEEAGVSVGALYQYLPDREAITAALVARYHARLERLLDDAVDTIPARGGDPVGALIGAVADVFRDERAVRELRGVAGSTALDAMAREHKARMALKVDAVLRAAGLATAPAMATQDGDGRSGPSVASVTARLVFASADAVLHEAFAADEPVRGELIAELERMLRGALGVG